MTVPLRGPHPSVKICARCEDLRSLCAAKTTHPSSLTVPPVQQIRPMTWAQCTFVRRTEAFSPPTRHFCLSEFILQIRTSHRPPQRTSSSTAVLSGRSRASPTPVRLNYIKIARQQTNFDGCTLEKHHVTFIYSCIHLFVRTSETRIALTTCLQKKRGSVGLLRFQPLTLDIKAVRYFTLMCFFMKKKEKCSRWPLCGASSFVGCLSVCSWRKGTFSLTELERKASAYSQPWNLLAKFLLAIWKISHIAQLESCDPDGELKACGGGRGWREERQEMKNGGWNQGKRARQSLWCTWMR